jgi:lipid-A-disaccharide synthase-like uncharacterized protein
MPARILRFTVPIPCAHWFISLFGGAVCCKCGARKAPAPTIVPFPMQAAS